MRKENDYQSTIVNKLEIIFPDCDVLKNDSRCIQGFPDWSVFYMNKVALLEIKRSEHERHRPNQDYYINKYNKQGLFARFIYPENEAAVISDLIKYFKGETSDEI